MIRFLVLSVLVLSVAGSAAFRLHTEHRIRTEQSAIAKLDKQHDRLRAEIDRLSFEVDVLESAPRLNELSAERLPLAPGSAGQMADGDVLRDVIDPAAGLEI
ncbi:MAG: hypothetical protein AAF830_03155, partial [Pseudomonadota bacterium]